MTWKSPVAGSLEGFFPAPFCLSKIYHFVGQFLMIPAPKRETYEDDDDDRVPSCGGFRFVSKNCSTYPSFHLGV